MSKASEWRQKLFEAQNDLDAVKRARPTHFDFVVSAADTFYFTIDDDGMPRLTTPAARNGYQPEPKALLDLAAWIQETFGEGHGRAGEMVEFVERVADNETGERGDRARALLAKLDETGHDKGRLPVPPRGEDGS